MGETPKKNDKLTAFQRAAVGMFISCAAVYELLLKSPDLQKAMGIGYPWFLMVLTMFGLSCAAVSGRQIGGLIESIKAFLAKKKEE